MQRWSSILLGFSVLILAFALAAKGMSPAPHARDARMADTRGDDAATGADVHGDAGTAPASPTLTAPIPEPLAPGESPPGDHLPDNAKPVRFGVVLVTYEGAQGAPDKARSPKEAREIAAKLALDARADFHGAVVRGDSGSIDDAGRMPRGVLDPGTEYKIFTMQVGAVSDPIDTPRGFWIVKRLE